MAVALNVTAISSAKSSVADAAKFFLEFLQEDPVPDLTIRGYLDSVACDLEASAESRRNGYAKERLKARNHFVARTRRKKKHRKSSNSTATVNATATDAHLGEAKKAAKEEQETMSASKRKKKKRKLLQQDGFQHQQ